jgi:SAM-dependent methyltransferase
MPRKNPPEKKLRLYYDLADWFHLLTAPDDYKEEVEFYSQVIVENSRIPLRDVLELGSGGGNSASHMKSRFKMTLTDISEDMLKISRRLNPECEHIQGDMRSLRLGRQFDAVFIQDAITYMLIEADLLKAMKTAFIHCRPGGVALFVPDYIRETFTPATRHGGHDGKGRSMRYLEWTWDPDPDDTWYYVDFAYLFREGETARSEYERHTFGLFAEKVWHDLLVGAGFTDIKTVPYPKTMKWQTPVFVGARPE